MKSVMGAQFEDYREVRGTSGLEALPDFLAAITDAAEKRRLARAQARPGDDAKAVEPLDVVTTRDGSTPTKA